MKKLTSNEIRDLWLEFFKSKEHYIVPSASLIPVNDKSLLWINSGVATLKPYFDGREKPPAPRLTNSQKAIRTGDIENVGITTRHHTFFEMLGNFSIGDYFKKEAIAFGWELLTSKEWLDIDPSLLYITVFKDDKEALQYWIEQGVDEDRIFEMDRNTNFWDMGKGPCGPSSEIFFDKGEEYDSRSAKELIKEDIDNDRYVEIWNIVFSEFNNDGEGNYTKLPQQNIDTGAGLERIVSAIQGKPSNFETDLFVKMIKLIDDNLKHNKYQFEYIPSKLLSENRNQFFINSWYKKIVDYIRSVSFAISDGALPDATGRGYIIRMLLRKAMINKMKLGIEDEFLHKLVDPLVETMGHYYPNLISKKDIIIETIRNEERQYNKTLLNAKRELLKLLESEDFTNENKEEEIFKLHETYGLPLDFLKDLSEDSSLSIDWNKMKEIEKRFKELSRGNGTSDAMNIQDDTFRGLGETEFIGYIENESVSKVLFVNGDYVVFDKTPFYATSGGQESDFGKANDYEVKYVEKNAEKTFIHHIPGHTFNVGDEVNLSIDIDRRKGLTLHHSATHLLFGALDKITGMVIPQQGSKVEEDFLRFDFAYQKQIDEAFVKQIEDIANVWAKNSTDVVIKEMTLDEAKELEAGYLEGTKYADIVRVVIMNDEVIDMCGGTHVSNTSEIKGIKVTNWEKRGSGIWRLEAVVGEDNINKVIIKENEKFRDDILMPMLNKAEVLNVKIKEFDPSLNTWSYEVQYTELNQFIEESSYLEKAKELVERIKSDLASGQNTLTDLIEKKIKSKFENEDVIIIESSNLNVQEVTRPMLNTIDDCKGNIAIAIINNADKVTYGFVINKNLIESHIVDRIKVLAQTNGLNGNGKLQQYIFGGSKIDSSKIIEVIKKWEF